VRSGIVEGRPEQRGLLEEADRQLGGACCLDLGAGTRRQIRSSRAEGICEGGLELRSGRGSICCGGWSSVRGRMGHEGVRDARSDEAISRTEVRRWQSNRPIFLTYDCFIPVF
jgi:hypothetical protein